MDVTTNPLIEKVDKDSPSEIQQESQHTNGNERSLYLKNRDHSGRLRRIDYILVYNNKPGESQHLKAYRETFISNITSIGLVVEQEDRPDIIFLKIHAPYKVLYKYAEILQMRMPLEINNLKLQTRKSFFKGIMRKFASFSEPMLFPEDDDDNKDLCMQNPYNYFTAPFTVARKTQFAVNKEMKEENFFTIADRNRIVFTILNRAIYEASENPGMMAKTGVNKLIQEGSLTAAYPLHDGHHLWDETTGGGPWYQNIDKLNHLQKLYYTWASPKAFYKIQPMDPIRRYFGEKIAMYFAWLGFYTQCLFPAAIVGLFCFIYGVVTMTDDTIAHEVCYGPPSKYVMCPRCDNMCDFWYLKDACTNVQMSQMFDNFSTVIFAMFMAIWGSLFLEFWKRKQNTIALKWDLFGFEEEQDAIRPQYEALAMEHKKPNSPWWRENPITEAIEPFMPFTVRLPRLAFSIGTVVFMILVVFAAVVAVILYRMIFIGVYSGMFGSTSATLATSGTAAMLNLVGITILSKLYEKIAVRLTEFESPRTETQYEDSYTMKMFIFQFVNYYTCIFYIAFIKGRFTGYPGHYRRLFGVRQEECQPGGCLMELTLQLGIIMVGKQIFDNFKELMIPIIFKCMSKRKIKEEETEEELKSKMLPRYEADYVLNEQPPQNLFYEYLELVIQFGFITLFVAAFPLAPFFALLNNIIELRLDAYKFITQLRRPWAQKSQDIGSWFPILEGIAVLAVITNAIIIAIESRFITKLVYSLYSGSDDLTGYTNFTLSYLTVNNASVDPLSLSGYMESMKNSKLKLNITDCRYEDFRNPPDSSDPYALSPVYWYVLTARLAFVILFEHIVFGLKFLISYLVPDFPESVRVEKLRCEHLSRTLLYDSEKNNIAINALLETNVD